jgi:hypothetical protein
MMSLDDSHRPWMVQYPIAMIVPDFDVLKDVVIA